MIDAGEGRRQAVEELILLIRELSRRFKYGIQLPEGLSLMDGWFLRMLADGTPKSAGALARHFGVSQSYVTNWAERLVRRGLVRRERSALDRRIVYLALTEAGRRAVDNLEAERRRLAEALFGNVTDEELWALADLLRRMLARLDGGSADRLPSGRS